MLVHDLARPSLKWRTSHQQFVGHDSQGVLIASCHRMPIPLLRSHIGWCAPDARACAGGRARKFGDAKVGEQQVRTLGLVFAHADEEISGLDILVKHVLVMGVLQRIGACCTRGTVSCGAIAAALPRSLSQLARVPSLR